MLDSVEPRQSRIARASGVLRIEAVGISFVQVIFLRRAILASFGNLRFLPALARLLKDSERSVQQTAISSHQV